MTIYKSRHGHLLYLIGTSLKLVSKLCDLLVLFSLQASNVFFMCDLNLLDCRVQGASVLLDVTFS